jgi:hypothetical protein
MYKLLVNNIDILPKSNNLGWNSDIDTLGTELSFDSLYNIPEGTVVSIHINNNEHIRAVVVKKSEKKFSYSYTCFDFSFYLKNEVVKQFNTTASAAIISLLNEYGIKNAVVSIPTHVSKIYKDESISGIIDDILSQAENEQGIKYFREMQADILVISKLTDMKITPKILIGSDIVINSSIEDMKNKIIIVSGDEKNTSIIASVEDKVGQSKYGLLQVIETVDEKDISKAKNIANNLLKAQNKIFKDTSIPLLGIKDAETIKANRLIELNVGTKLKGWYKIKSASHSLSNNKHAVSISLEW